VHEAQQQLFQDSLMGTSTGIPTFGGAGFSRRVMDVDRMEESGARGGAGDGSVLGASGFLAPQGQLLPHGVVDRIVEFNVANMSLSAVYLHEMHRRRVSVRFAAELYYTSIDLEIFLVTNDWNEYLTIFFSERCQGRGISI
jgi:hypothetical protein